MGKKRVDSRVRGLIELGVRKNHRSMFVIVGDYGKDQVEILHAILTRSRVKARPSVLWCYKKELGFSTHKKKRMREIKRNKQRGLHDPDIDDPFDLFVSSTNIRWAYYKDSEKILGQTFGMCVLQDFEAITPNLLARTIETVEGGGIVVLLLKTVKSLNQLYTMTMDVHARYRTEAHHEIVPRFNERFILSLSDNPHCLVIDDELNILPISSHVHSIPDHDSFGAGMDEGDVGLSGIPEDPELKEIKSKLLDTPHIGALIQKAKTSDQAKAVLSFLDAISEQTLRYTVSLTAGRGRGKSAAIGLCLAGAISYGYANVFVTAPSPENLKTVFEFLVMGLKDLKYTEHLDFEIVYEHFGEVVGKVATRINIFRGHRQTIQYIQPTEHEKLSQAELVAVDEAAAIPLPVLKKLFGRYLVFLSSTVNGYEGTGRALSLKLLQNLRQQQGAALAAAATEEGNKVGGSRTGHNSGYQAKGDKGTGGKALHEERWKVAAEAASNLKTGGASGSTRSLTEITLDTPIRYNPNDPIEKWLNNLLCLDIVANSTRIVQSIPYPKDCELYHVDRDALFSYHGLAETMLQRIWALYTSAHYKNSPNDLQMLSDAPAHRLFVLLGPQQHYETSSSSAPAIPDILCVVQVALEGKISRESVQNEMRRGNKASGDMIPWVMSQQYNDNDFAGLSGARVVRIATHPDVQRMGYGSRAIDLLSEYYQGILTAHLDPLEVDENSGTVTRPPTEFERAANATTSDLHSEEIAPRKKLPPLMVNICDYQCERLHWLGVSFGLTDELLNFWSRKKFSVCYIRQTSNELTGEYSTLMLRELQSEGMVDAQEDGWLEQFVHDYRRRIISLLSYTFSSLPISVAVTLIDPSKELSKSGGGNESDDFSMEDSTNNQQTTLYRSNPLGAKELTEVHMTLHDIKRLELYARNMVDHHMVLDLIPVLARLLFAGRIPSVRMSKLQLGVLLAIGLQQKTVDSIGVELDLPVNQVLAFFGKTVRKITNTLKASIESQIKASLPSERTLAGMEARAASMESLPMSLKEDQLIDQKEFEKMAKAQKNLIVSLPRQITDGDANSVPDAAMAEMKKKKKKKNKNSWQPKGSNKKAKKE